jgi:hypothetical protein
MPRNKQVPPESIAKNVPPDFINGLKIRRTENPFKIVANHKSKENPLLRTYLIELTERLAAGAKDGTLKGLGGFADYGDSYMLGLEGSYLEDPTAAVLPMKLLEKRVMDQIEQEE